MERYFSLLDKHASNSTCTRIKVRILLEKVNSEPDLSQVTQSFMTYENLCMQSQKVVLHLMSVILKFPLIEIVGINCVVYDDTRPPSISSAGVTSLSSTNHLAP